MKTRDDTIRQEVRKTYRDKAVQSCQTGCSSRLGYSEDDLASAPVDADLGLGCGNPQAIAALRPGETVVDLGSGAGFDCFLAARRVGCAGRVIGVDMTAEMVEKARSHARSLGLSNVAFVLGEIEHLPLDDACVDVVLSNCVIVLSPDKDTTYREAFRVLRPGGRLAIADVVRVREISPEQLALIRDEEGCIAGAISVESLRDMLAQLGFVSIRIDVNPRSAELIGACMPGAEGYVGSASIQAHKPEA